jgi:hypothetical protein
MLPERSQSERWQGRVNQLIAKAINCGSELRQVQIVILELHHHEQIERLDETAAAVVFAPLGDMQSCGFLEQTHDYIGLLSNGVRGAVNGEFGEQFGFGHFADGIRAGACEFEKGVVEAFASFVVLVRVDLRTDAREHFDEFLDDPQDVIAPIHAAIKSSVALLSMAKRNLRRAFWNCTANVTLIFLQKFAEAICEKT